MEALRNQLESLQWEVNRLDVENRWLLEADEQATKLVDLQTELEQSKNEAVTLQERLRATEERKSTLLACTTKTDGDQRSASTVRLEQLAGQCPVSSPTIDISGVVLEEIQTFTYICNKNDDTLVGEAWFLLVIMR